LQPGLPKASQSRQFPVGLKMHSQ